MTKLKETPEERLSQVDKIAESFGFEVAQYDDNSKRVRYQNGKYMVDVYLTKMTVGIIRQNQPQEFEKKCSLERLQKIFSILTGITVTGLLDKSVSYYQPLFEYMSREHNVILLQSEMDEIINIVKKLK